MLSGSARTGPYALHALWREGARLALWAEDLSALGGSATEVGAAEGRHPFACSAGRLGELLAGCGPALRWLASSAVPATGRLTLPSTRRGPRPSPELSGPSALTGDRAPGPSTGPATWRLDLLEFDPAAAAQLLGELFDPYPYTGMVLSEPAGGRAAEVWFGGSLRWLIAVHDLAWRTLRRGRLLPGLRTERGRPHARWQAVPDAGLRAWAAALEAATPAVARADGGNVSVADIVDALLDGEVRTTMAERAPLLPAGRVPGPRPGAIADRRWLRALTSTSGEIVGVDPVADRVDPMADGGGELDALRRRLARWYRSSPEPTGLKLYLRLAEPLGPDPVDPMSRTSDDHWRIDLLLQSVREPALMVEAAAFWTDPNARRALARTVDDPEKVFLDDVDRAVRCYPPLREMLREPDPRHLVLDRAAALAFLQDGAPMLAEAGFGILLPSWWRTPPRLGLRMTARPVNPGVVQTRSVVDRDAVVGFDWQVALGDRRLTSEELHGLAAATLPLVRVRGQWTLVDPGQIAAALEFLRREGSGVTTAAAVLATAIDPEPVAAGLPVLGIDGHGWLAELFGTGDDAPPALAAGWFRAELRPYQERGVRWLSVLSRLGLGAVLADDMGLGKTVQTLALLALEQQAGATGCTLLICPMSVVGNWQREAARFAPGLRVHVHHGTDRDPGELPGVVREHDLVITTYPLVRRDLAVLRGISWERVVADEAQQIKNAVGQQARAVRALRARHRIALTGTPVENRLADLHAVLDFANPGMFGSALAFRERYSVPIERHRDARAAEQLHRRTAAVLLRRSKTDPAIAAELPDKVEISVPCTLTVEQAALYRAVVDDLLDRVTRSRGTARKGVVLAGLGKLKQICDHPAVFLKDSSRPGGRSGKLARLESLLETAIAEGDRALCFTQYVRFGHLLQPYLTRRLGREVLFLHGGTPRGERDAMVRRFGDPDAGAPAVFLLSLRAGGTGLNLTAANHVVHLDRWWNPAVEDQATDRAFRIGQRRGVQVRRLVCVGTVEERIDEIIGAKRSLAELAVTSDLGGLTELSVDELAQLIRWDPDA